MLSWLNWWSSLFYKYLRLFYDLQPGQPSRGVFIQHVGQPEWVLPTSLAQKQLVLVVCRYSWSARRHASHTRVNKGEVTEHRLVDAVDERAVGTRQPRLLVDELLVEVAAIARRCLRGQRWNVWSQKPLFHVHVTK